MFSTTPTTLISVAIFFIFAKSAAELPKFTFDDADMDAAKKAALVRHNLYRCMHNAPALTLDDETSKISQAHAERLAKEFKNIEPSGNPDLGENTGMASAFITPTTKNKPNMTAKVLQIVDSFYTGSREQVGNNTFSQVVWKASTQLGVGIAIEERQLPTGNEFLLFYTVFNYKPPGNVAGKNVENVEQKPSKTKDQCKV